MKKIVLMYHDIIPDQDYSSGMHVPASDTYKLNNMKFEEQVAAIRDYLDKNNLPSESVEFTFDDGGYTFLTEAAPILEKYGFKGVFFVTTSFIDQDGFLTSAQVKELSTRGHVVGSHSHWHNPEMMKKSAEENRQEWQMSVEKLKSITKVSHTRSMRV